MRPDANPNFPELFYKSKLTRPHIDLKVDTKSKYRGNSQFPTVEMYLAWFNEVKKYRIWYDRSKKKYLFDKIYGKDFGNVFLVGTNIQMLSQ